MQVKLLRALQESEVDPVGSKRPVKVDVRIISATNRDLAVMAQDGNFREDLFYRLNVFPIMVPSLRDRPGDISPLARHFIARFAAEENKPVTGLTPQASQLIERFYLARQCAPGGEHHLPRRGAVRTAPRWMSATSPRSPRAMGVDALARQNYRPMQGGRDRRAAADAARGDRTGAAAIRLMRCR